MRCGYNNRPRKFFPCSECKVKGIDCKNARGREPITCLHCRWYYGVNKTVCHKRNGYNIRPCEEFEWD